MSDRSFTHPEYMLLVMWLIALALCYYTDQRIMSDQRNRITQLEAALKVHNIPIPDISVEKDKP